MPCSLTSPARELLKWLALLLMTGDHLAKVVWGGYVPVLSELGRVAFPLFAIVLACNLAQPGADALKSARRLLPWAVLAQPAWAAAFNALLPLNVLWTFALVAACLALWQRGRSGWAMALFALGGMWVEYRWFGAGLVLAWWLFWRSQASAAAPRHEQVFHALLAVAGLVLLCVYNGNGWAMLALPLVLLLGGRDWPIPRIRWIFYLYYIGHLAVLALWWHWANS